MMAAVSLTLRMRTLAIAFVMGAAALGAHLARPVLHETEQSPHLEASLPNAFGGWQALASPVQQVSLNKGNEPDINQPYDESVLRGYVDQDGHQVYLAVAWGRRQRQEVKIHRPELCYPAQGLAVKNLKDHTFSLRSDTTQLPVEGKRMLTVDRNGMLEAVSYWIRIGSIYSDSAIETRLHILKEGLAGRVTDGLLMRVSQRVPADTAGADLEAVFERQERFAEELVRSVTPATRDYLVR